MQYFSPAPPRPNRHAHHFGTPNYYVDARGFRFKFWIFSQIFSIFSTMLSKITVNFCIIHNTQNDWLFSVYMVQYDSMIHALMAKLGVYQ